ncbi:MAG: aspartate aminotransferase family protein, partial [Deltaproteobacteria bacterium]|nr:aspartate aminotransferase family protein [Deltaproteobacteria bacterium]
ATIGELRRRDVPAALDRLGGVLRDKYNRLASDLAMTFTRCVGYGCRTLVAFDSQGLSQGDSADPLVMKSFVQQELLRRGILWSGFHNLSAAHAPSDVDCLLAAYREILPELRDGVLTGDLRNRLRGEPVEAIFRRTSQFNTKPVGAGGTDARQR